MSRSKEFVGFGRRFVARILDEIIIVWIPTLILVLLMVLLRNESLLPFFVIVWFLWVAIPGNFYFIHFHHKTGQTIGKKLLGVKVVKIDGKPLTWGDAFVRWFGYLIASFPLFLGLFWIAFDEKKQGWHDKIAGTYVVRVK